MGREKTVSVKVTSTHEDRRKKNELLKQCSENENQDRPSVKVTYDILLNSVILN